LLPDQQSVGSVMNTNASICVQQALCWWGSKENMCVCDKVDSLQ